MPHYVGHAKNKSLGISRDSKDPDQLAKLHNLLKTFVIYQYYKYSIQILLADSGGLDQTVPVHRLILAFTVCMGPEDMFSHGMAQINQGPVVQSIVSLTS